MAPHRLLSTSLVWLSLVASGSAQNSLESILSAPGLDLREDRQRLDTVAKMEVLMAAKHQAARAKAVQLGLPVRTVQADGRIVEIVDFIGDKPQYFTTTNLRAGISTGANLLQQAPYNLTGSGLTVGVWDGGGVRTTHQELTGRVTIKDGAALADHSTHVAGTIGATGVDAAARGMAPAVRIDSYEWTNDKSEMTGRGASYPGEPGKIYLSNHSYGIISGWNYTGLVSPRWTWFGSGTTTTGFEVDFGKYEAGARDTDSMAASLPYYLILRSAGNERLDNPVAGEPVSLTTSTASAVSYDPALHPKGDGAYRGGYDTIGFDAVAKNVLTVGSVGDAVSGSTRFLGGAYMASYSSWGPTDDGRIKPDVVANGEDVHSSLAGADTAYGNYNGTSMATPNTTGSAALVVNWWNALNPGHALRSSTLKGLLIHTADDLGTAGPDYQFGWGLINVKSAADLLQAYQNSPGTRRVLEDRITTTIPSATYAFTWNGTSPIRATLCWTDPAATATNSTDLRTACLVNNLNLKITGPTGIVYAPWVMPFVGDWTNAKFTAAAITGVNNTDNVERVDIAAPGNAGLYTVTVNYTGALTNSVQNFSLLLSGGAVNATAPAPTAVAVTPSVGSVDTMTLNLTGAGFLLGGNVKLTKSGQPDVLASNQEIRSEQAIFRINVNGMASGLWNVVLTNPDGQSANLPASFSIAGPLWQDNLETIAVGMTHSATSPFTIDNWALTTTQSSSPTHSYFAAGPGSRNINDLYTPEINIPAGAANLRFSFMHNFNFQSTRDGGVLEFSINGGTFFDVTSNGSGAAFTSGGYNSNLAVTNPSSSRNPLAGRTAWSGTKTGFSKVTVDLTDSAKYAGKTLQIRWRLATNGSTTSPGWYVDDIALAGVSAGNLPPSIVTDATATPTPVLGLSTQLTALGDDDAGEPGLTYTWIYTGGTFDHPASFSENGTNAAKSTTATFGIAGNYTFEVTVRDAQGLTSTSSVGVTVEQTATNISVLPLTATIPFASTQTFTASVLDQFTEPMVVQPPLSWSTNGGGSINAAGVFTATSVGGPYEVTATSASVNGTSSITVTKATAALTLGNLSQIYNGAPKSATIATSPGGLNTTVTYNSSATLPVDFGPYTVLATIIDANYQGTATDTLWITGLPFQTWKTQNFTLAQISAGFANDTADPDLDGWDNLAEYALGTNPNFSSFGMSSSYGPGGMSILFSRPKGLPDVNYGAESSPDIQDWTPLPLTIITDGPVQTLRATDPLTTGNGARRFLRLKFTR